ncbi:inhibitor of nuclear factor kappa-B kinase-interacting protein isoform X2 [Ambystoma mexicanum]|uniref:inhibitor of nuclear factor kappa-B kinase-interacting protein isoform X2 n=1 Tax=Ambystoma mexicanum TaxID=8296 RepID=UPI0037E8F85E
MFLPHLHPEALPSGICPRPPDLPVCGSLKGDACEHARTSGLYKPIDAVLAGFIVVKAVLGKLAFIHLYVHNIDSRCLRIFKMSNDVKQRRKGPPKPNEEGKAEHPKKAANTETLHSTLTPAACTDSPRLFLEPRTLLCILSLCVCVASTWFAFEQSVAYSSMQKRFTLLEMKASELKALEDKIGLLFEKCEHSQSTMEQLKNPQILKNMESLQQDINHIKEWSKTLADKREQLQQNMTALFQTIAKTEQSTASVASDVSGKITIVKTDIRRISGLGSDANELKDSVQELESKLEKVVKKTEQNIGHLLASNIERITELKGSVNRNSERIEMMKRTFSELLVDYKKHSDMLLDLQRDRVKVLKTLTFVNDLKPKVNNMKNDFALLDPMANDLALRIGRLASDLLQREGEIALLNEKVSSLNQVTTEVNNMKDTITNL